MPTKAPDAFRTISEVAEELDLPQHVLRFWETRFTQIKPMKRGGGRRYYRPEDVDLLRGVRLLLYGEGFTIRGVQRLLKDKGVAFVVAAGQRGSVQTAGAVDFGPEDREEDGSPAQEPAPKKRQVPAVRAQPRAADADEDGGQVPEAAPVQDEPAPIDDPPSDPLPPRARALVLPERRRRLKAALDDLLEAKRLLEQARG